MSEEERKSKSSPGSRAKLAAFSLMLAVPAVLSGCGTTTNDDCDPKYDDNSCERSSSHSSYRGGSSFYNGSKDKSSYSSSGSSSSKSSGFGGFFSGSGG